MRPESSYKWQIAFVRTHGSPDRVHVTRPDGSAVSWSFPTYGPLLPHDLVHLVVESAFGLAHGFWGRVARGVDPARVNADANRRGGRDKYAAFGEDLGELRLAEALANARWFDPRATDADRLEDVRRECVKAEIDEPAKLSLERLRSVYESLQTLTQRWQAFGTKGTLRLTVTTGHDGTLDWQVDGTASQA